MTRRRVIKRYFLRAWIFWFSKTGRTGDCKSTHSTLRRGVKKSAECQTLAVRLGMSALGQKPTFAPQNVMSALPPKADMCSARGHVRFGPKADIRAVAEMERPPRGGLSGICSDVRVTRWKNGR